MLEPHNIFLPNFTLYMIYRRIYRIFIISLLLSTLGCNSNYLVVKHIKPKNYDRPYDPKKDKKKQRTKKVKRLIIRQRN